MDKSYLIKKIKEKNEFRGVADSFIESVVENYVKKYKIDINLLEEKDARIVMKEIRAELRNFTGKFQIGKKNRADLLEKNKIKELLSTHASTYERLYFYPKLKHEIKKLSPKSILDLGCGLNPIALAKKGIYYYALDIRDDELNLIKKYFEKNNIDGETKFFDLRKSSFKDLPEADLCIIFKVLDVITEDYYEITEKILRNVKCKFFMISFSKIKLSGKIMNSPEREWFENLLLKNKFRYKKFYSKNEIFYLVFKLGPRR